jgi:hypothetical protein
LEYVLNREFDGTQGLPYAVMDLPGNMPPFVFLNREELRRENLEPVLRILEGFLVLSPHDDPCKGAGDGAQEIFFLLVRSMAYFQVKIDDSQEPLSRKNGDMVMGMVIDLSPSRFVVSCRAIYEPNPPCQCCLAAEAMAEGNLATCFYHPIRESAMGLHDEKRGFFIFNEEDASS